MYSNKTIILTGASEGIGRALALELATDAPNLVLAARNRERLESLAVDCESLGAKCLVLPTDVTDETACRELIEKAVEHFGGLDVLINNAGGSMWARLDEMQDTSALESLMRLNYLSAAWCSYYALPELKKSRGQVVAVASVAGLTGVPAHTVYSATKHAMIGFFDSLRIELAGDGVAVTVIAPDFVLSEIHQRALGPDGQPLGKSRVKKEGVMTSEQCAALIYKSMAARKRLLITSFRGKLGRLIRILAPSVIDRIAINAVAGLH
jgi:short-subunit dehydrogenase